MAVIRLSKAALVLAVAFFLFLVVLNNLVAPEPEERTAA